MRPCLTRNASSEVAFTWRLNCLGFGLDVYGKSLLVSYVYVDMIYPRELVEVCAMLRILGYPVFLAFVSFVIWFCFRIWLKM